MTRLTDIFFTLFIYALVGLVSGLLLFAAVGLLVDQPSWFLLVFGLVLPLHWQDLRRLAWRGRLVRMLWLATLLAVSVGAIWLMLPLDPEKFSRWSRAWFIYPPLVGAAAGGSLGVAHALFPQPIDRYLAQAWATWLRWGGY